MESQVGIKATIPINGKMKDIFIKTYHANDTMHTDQTGSFPAMSSSGNQYIMVLVEINGNYIDAEPLKKNQMEQWSKHI
jgi:hypothetical protein